MLVEDLEVIAVFIVIFYTANFYYFTCRFFPLLQCLNFQVRLSEMLRLHFESSNVSSEQERTTKILRSFLDLLIENMIQTSNYTCLTHQRVYFCFQNYNLKKRFDITYLEYQNF